MWTDRVQTVNAGHTVGGGVWTDCMQTGNAGHTVGGVVWTDRMQTVNAGQITRSLSTDALCMPVRRTERCSLLGTRSVSRAPVSDPRH